MLHAARCAVAVTELAVPAGAVVVLAGGVLLADRVGQLDAVPEQPATTIATRMTSRVFMPDLPRRR
jgi:hypothetical protein